VNQCFSNYLGMRILFKFISKHNNFDKKLLEKYFNQKMGLKLKDKFDRVVCS